MMRGYLQTVAVCLLGTIAAHADLQADARKIQETYQDAVVYLTGVIEIDRGGRKREASIETLGTIVSAEGLIVTATSISPS